MRSTCVFFWGLSIATRWGAGSAAMLFSCALARATNECEGLAAIRTFLAHPKKRPHRYRMHMHGLVHVAMACYVIHMRMSCECVTVSVIRAGCAFAKRTTIRASRHVR
eukprot:9487000-Pyramimonas_sp.AAC.1